MIKAILAIRRILLAKQSGESPSTDTVSSSLFYGYSSLTSIPEPLSLEGLSNVTDANEMYRGCTILTSIPDSWEGLEWVTVARACGGELV